MAISITGYIGRQTIQTTNHILCLFAFGYRILVHFVGTQKQPGESGEVRRVILEQMYFSCIKALPVIFPVALFIGSMLIIQLTKISGQYDVGQITVLLIVRELGPIITALLVILRSATAMTSEVCCMITFNEIHALEEAGRDPMRIVCFPRLIGITTGIFCLFIIFNLSALLGGYAVVWMIAPVPLGSFLAQVGKALTLTDIFVAGVKAISFGMVISVTSLYHGFRDQTQTADIPTATSRAALECFFYCLVINVAISTLFYL